MSDLSKICNKCNEKKGISSFSKNNSSHDGLRSMCKQCDQSRPVKVNTVPDEQLGILSRQCTLCGVTKLLALYHRAKQGLYGRSSRCKGCTKLKYLKNRSAISDRNRLKYLEHAEELKIRSKLWQKANPLKARGYSRKRSAYVRATNCGNVDYAEILLRDNNTCYLCAIEIPHVEQSHFDHIIPISKGGLHATQNIAATHATCNLSKSNKLPHELSTVLHQRVVGKLTELSNSASDLTS